LKKVTLKEIALQTGVSAATVSYVLNNVTNQTIAEDTRARILDTAKALGYVPNLAARSLVKQQSGLIGLLINQPAHASHWRLLRHSDLIHDIEIELNKHGYHLIIHSLDATSPKLDIIAERKLDGVIVVDAIGDHFHHISQHFPHGVPVLIVDSLINDPLFYQVMFDYEEAFLRKTPLKEHPNDYYVVLDDYNNQELLAHISNLLPLPDEHIYIMSSELELQKFLTKQQGRKGIIVNEGIALLAAKYTSSELLTVICTTGMSELLPPQAQAILFKESKGTVAVTQLLQLLANSVSDINHKQTIKIEAE
jgi:transcriptional regulator with XRE-family HTH domain